MKLSLNASRYVTGALSTAILAAGAVTFTPSVAQADNAKLYGGYVLKIQGGGCITPSVTVNGNTETRSMKASSDCTASQAVWHIWSQNGKSFLSAFTGEHRIYFYALGADSIPLDRNDNPGFNLGFGTDGQVELYDDSTNSAHEWLNWSDNHLHLGEKSKTNVTLENLKGEKAIQGKDYPSPVPIQVLPKPHISANCHWGTLGTPSTTWFKSIDVDAPQLPDGYALPEGTRIVVASQNQDVLLNYPVLPTQWTPNTMIPPSFKTMLGWSVWKTFDDDARTNGDGTKYVRFEDGGKDADAHKHDGSGGFSESLDNYHVFFVSPEGYRSEPAKAELRNHDWAECTSDVKDNGDIRPSVPPKPQP